MANENLCFTKDELKGLAKAHIDCATYLSMAADGNKYYARLYAELLSKICESHAIKIRKLPTHAKRWDGL